MSNFYLAGRLDTGEGTISGLSDELESRDHYVLEKWFEAGRLPKPYLKHMDLSGPAAAAMIRAAFESDVFVLFPTDDILGAAVEFGAALGSQAIKSGKVIAVVNPFEVRQSVFYAHPGVVALRNLAELRELDCY